MGFFSAITDFLGGGLVKTITDTVREYFPPDMDPETRAKIEQAAADAVRQHELKLLELAAAQDAEFNRRIIDMEGTASDLKSLPVLGGFLLFLRGAQRPVWGFATLALDWYSFTGSWEMSDKQETILLVINLLVLGFLFGERAVKNITPLLAAYFGKKA